MSEDKAMSEQKGLEAEYAAIDARLNSVQIEQGATVQWRHDTMRDGVWRRGTAEMWGWEEQLWYVRDAEGFLVKVAADEANIMVAKDGLPLTAEEQLAALKADLEAYRSTFEEVNEAYHKTHSERYALNEQNVELRAEVAELEAELERRSKVALEKYAALERDRDLVENAMREASARAQRNEDNLKAVLTREEALRAQLIALEEGAAASRNTARQVAQIAHDRAYEIERQKHEIAHIEKREREALAEAAAQRERADMWQAAAQDALDQMAHWRKQAKEKTKLCDMPVGIDFRDQRSLAEIARSITLRSDEEPGRG